MDESTQLVKINGKKYLKVFDEGLTNIEACQKCCFGNRDGKYVTCKRPNDPAVKGCMEGKFHWQNL